MSRVRICLGLAMYEVMVTEWFRSVWVNGGHSHGIIPPTQGMHYAELVQVQGFSVAEAYNLIVQEALEKRTWDVLVTLEQDTVPPKGFLDHIAQHDFNFHPIIAGLYYARKLDRPLPLAYRWHDSDEGPRTEMRNCSPEEMAHMISHPGLHEVDVVPLGCTAIHRRVFEQWPAIDMPWFATPMQRTGRAVSPDVYFCRGAQQNGHRVFIDSAMECDHLGTFPVGRGAYVGFLSREKQRQDQERPQLWNPKPKLEVVPNGS